MKRVLIVGAILAIAALALAQVPGASQFHFPGEDPWWRPFNPQGQSYGVSVGTTRPVRTLGNPQAAPYPGEIFMDMDGGLDGGPILELWDNVNSEWDDVSAEALTGLTDNTIPVYDSATGGFIDSGFVDDATDITVATGREIRLHDGSTADDAVVFGATQDYAIYWDDGNSSLHIDSVAAAGNVRIIGDSSTRGATILSLHSQGDPSTFIHSFADLTAVTNGGTMWNLGLGGTIGAMAGSATTRAFHIDLVNGAHTGTGNTYSIIDIEPFTGDANSNTNAILIGALTGTTGAAGEVETAINIASGWDNGIVIRSSVADGAGFASILLENAGNLKSEGNLAIQVANNSVLQFQSGGTPSDYFIMDTAAHLTNGTGANLFELGVSTLGQANGADTYQLLNLDFAMNTPSGTGNTYNIIGIDAVAGDAEANLNAINIGALTGTAPSSGEFETAILIGAGWDTGLAILADGSATDDNISLGASFTADFQMYFDNAGVVFDLDGTAGNTADFQIDGDDAASRSLLSLTGAFGILDGSDTQRGLYLNLANANHTGSANVVTALEIAAITGDAQATETGLIIGAGYDLAARFDAPIEKNAYRQDFDGPCVRRVSTDFGAELTSNAGVNIALCGGDIMVFTYRLDGAQSSPFGIVGNGLDIDNDGIDDEGVEIILTDTQGDINTNWVVVGTSPAMFFRANVTIASVSGTDNMYIGWREAEAFVDDLIIATYDTYGVHLINDTSGNLVIQTGDDTADGTDENDQVAAFGDGETHTFEVRVATNGDFSFFVDDLPVTESNATGAAATGEFLHPMIGLRNAASADTELRINWLEIGEVI